MECIGPEYTLRSTGSEETLRSEAPVLSIPYGLPVLSIPYGLRAPVLSIPNGLGALRVYANSIDVEDTPTEYWGHRPNPTVYRRRRCGMVLTYADSICKLRDGVNTGTPRARH